jgi:hypothetical protein
MISVVVLSKDRPAQLRLLLDSLDRNGNGSLGRPIVIAKGTSNDRVAAAGAWLWPESDSFDADIRHALDHCGRVTMFCCDDGILYRPVPISAARALEHDACLCVSLRLGENTTVQYPTGLDQAVPPHRPGEPFAWRWQTAQGDFGYPGSVDAHIFRTQDLKRMLRRRDVPNPTALELALVAGCSELADRRPYMGAFPRSCYVGVPVNRTSEQSNVRHGAFHPAPLDELEARWAGGERIDLRALDFDAVAGAHWELVFTWKQSRDRRSPLHV